jgi:hypothetical protein
MSRAESVIDAEQMPSFTWLYRIIARRTTANVNRVHLYQMGKIAATFPFQSTVAGVSYAGIASTSHNLEISNFFSFAVYFSHHLR